MAAQSDFLAQTAGPTVSRDPAMISALEPAAVKTWFTSASTTPHHGHRFTRRPAGYYWNTKHGNARRQASRC
jgi:hypothetical protein